MLSAAGLGPYALSPQNLKSDTAHSRRADLADLRGRSLYATAGRTTHPSSILALNALDRGAQQRQVKREHEQSDGSTVDLPSHHGALGRTLRICCHCLTAAQTLLLDRRKRYSEKRRVRFIVTGKQVRPIRTAHPTTC